MELLKILFISKGKNIRFEEKFLWKKFSWSLNDPMHMILTIMHDYDY